MFPFFSLFLSLLLYLSTEVSQLVNCLPPRPPVDGLDGTR